MLAAMNDRSFVVVYAYIKTEPVQVALFGLVFLGDVVTPVMAAAILIATSGVVIMALKPGTRRRAPLGRVSGACTYGVAALAARFARQRGTSMDVRATLLGLAAGALFALSAGGYRGAIRGLALPSYGTAATSPLPVGLLQ